MCNCQELFVPPKSTQVCILLQYISIRLPHNLIKRYEFIVHSLAYIPVDLHHCVSLCGLVRHRTHRIAFVMTQ